MFKFILRYAHDIEIAVESIISNKLKSMLTALGIIFGVAAVIAMLAIGKGAKMEIMEQMKISLSILLSLINPPQPKRVKNSRKNSAVV
jgi:ABC-type antimicrobial peptide transport system permease subunit